MTTKDGLPIEPPSKLVDEVERGRYRRTLARRFARVGLALWAASGGSEKIPISYRALAHDMGIEKSGLKPNYLTPAAQATPPPFSWTPGSSDHAPSEFELAPWFRDLLHKFSTGHLNARSDDRLDDRSVARFSSIGTSSHSSSTRVSKKMDGSSSIARSNLDDRSNGHSNHRSGTDASWQSSIGESTLLLGRVGSLEVRLVVGSAERPAANERGKARSRESAAAAETVARPETSASAATSPGTRQDPFPEIQLTDDYFELPPELEDESVHPVPSHDLGCAVPAAALAADVHWSPEFWAAVLQSIRNLLANDHELIHRKEHWPLRPGWYEKAVHGSRLGDGRISGGVARDPYCLARLLSDARVHVLRVRRERELRQRAAENRAKRERDEEARRQFPPSTSTVSVRSAAQADTEALRELARMQTLRKLFDELPLTAQEDLSRRARELAQRGLESVNHPIADSAIAVRTLRIREELLEREHGRRVPQNLEPASRADSSAETLPPPGIAAPEIQGAAP